MEEEAGKRYVKDEKIQNTMEKYRAQEKNRRIRGSKSMETGQNGSHFVFWHRFMRKNIVFQRNTKRDQRHFTGQEQRHMEGVSFLHFALPPSRGRG